MNLFGGQVRGLIAGLFKVLALACLLIVAGSEVGRAAVLERFRVGGWAGNAYSDSGGRLATCVAAARYKSGNTLYVQVDTSYRWAIGSSAPDWTLRIGSDVPLRFRIDGGAWQRGTAKATAMNLARMKMPDGGYIISRFRRGRSLYVDYGSKTYEFRLTGTSRLMKRMATCIDQNTARYGASPAAGDVTADSSASPDNAGTQPTESSAPRAAVDPAVTLEATQALFNLIGEAGLSGLRIVPEEQRSDNYKGLHAVAGNDARIVVAHIFQPGGYTSESDLMALVVADSRTNCQGTFSSGTEEVTSNGKQLLTSYCDCKGPDRHLFERTAIVKRKAGGVYVYSVANTRSKTDGGKALAPDLTASAFYSAAASAAN
ncbi:hypothetical protein FMN50_21205 [Rhodobacterales bacterium]|nr:hypothetical protein FMN50_21205 [Rhodobacterales bacterium]